VLTLASASPRRLALLRDLGLDPVPCPADVDERVLPGEAAETHALRLAREKARKVAAGLAGGAVLGADTVVVLDGRILGKPDGPDGAAAMLRLLAGRTHEVVTGVCVLNLDRTPPGEAEAAVRTRVRFRAYGEDTVRWYVASGEPVDKAGSYGIQGRGVLLAEGIEGSWSNVVGLPLETLPDLFRAAGLNWFP